MPRRSRHLIKVASARHQRDEEPISGSVAYKMFVMAVVSLGQVRDHLSELVSEVERTHERVTITRDGKPAAILVAPEDLEALEETLSILSTPGELERIRAAQAEIDAGDYITGEELAQCHVEEHDRVVGGPR